MPRFTPNTALSGLSSGSPENEPDHNDRSCYQIGKVKTLSLDGTKGKTEFSPSRSIVRVIIVIDARLLFLLFKRCDIEHSSCQIGKKTIKTMS